jgi:hypothetical protein
MYTCRPLVNKAKESYCCKQALDAHMVEAPTICGQKVVKSGILFGPPLPSGRFLVLIAVKRQSRPQDHCAAGRISIETCSMTSSGIEPATFRLLSYCLNQLHYLLSPLLN